MTVNQSVDWIAVLNSAAALCERVYAIQLDIDRDIVREITLRANDTLDALNMSSMPNVAKIAGHVAFWIRKLKPITHSQDSQNKLLTINEVIGILVGIGICQRYFDSQVRRPFKLPHRVMKDWAVSLRNHSHSPHSCAIAFEFLANEF
jgi:hypothetical protein